LFSAQAHSLIGLLKATHSEEELRRLRVHGRCRGRAAEVDETTAQSRIVQTSARLSGGINAGNASGTTLDNRTARKLATRQPIEGFDTSTAGWHLRWQESFK
jgi:hypothetical protein